jgi:hypothetical protein
MTPSDLQGLFLYYVRKLEIMYIWVELIEGILEIFSYINTCKKFPPIVTPLNARGPWFLTLFCTMSESFHVNLSFHIIQEIWAFLAHWLLRWF